MVCHLALWLVCQICAGVNTTMATRYFQYSANPQQREYYSIETLTKLILDTDSSVAKGKHEVCSTQPVQVCHNASFLVDLHSLSDAMDIRADENGVWDRKGSPVTYVSIHRNGSTTTVYKRSSHSHHYKVTRVYYRHSSSPDFTRIITTVNGKVTIIIHVPCTYTF